MSNRLLCSEVVWSVNLNSPLEAETDSRQVISYKANKANQLEGTFIDGYSKQIEQKLLVILETRCPLLFFNDLWQVDKSWILHF